MGINISNVYGNDSTWLKLDNNCTLATLSQEYTNRPYFNHTIGAGLAAGTLNTLNTSICPLAVDNGATIANGNYVMINTDGSLYNYTIDGAQTPLMYINSARGNSSSTIYNDFVNTNTTLASSTWDSGYVGNAYGVTNYPLVMTSLTQPLVDFPYRTFVWVILINASATDGLPRYDAKKISCDLATYVDKYYIDYPYVNCVSVNPFKFSYQTYSSANSVTSDTSLLTSTNPQVDCGLSIIAIGNCNNFVTYDNQKCLAYTSRNDWIEGSYRYANGEQRASIYSRLCIGGYGHEYSGSLSSTNRRALYIPNINNMFDIVNANGLIYTRYKVNDINAFRDWCLKQTAYLGMYFTPSINTIYKSKPDTLTTHDDMYMGIIDDSGITHGEYVHGTDIKKYAQSEWDNLKNQSPYDYTKRPDNSIYDNNTKLNTDRLFTVGSNVFTNVYAISRLTAFDLRQYLYSVVAPDSTTESNTKQFLTNNPIDCIVSCMQYPFNVIPETGSTAETIRLGNTNAKSTTGIDLSGYNITDCLRVLDFGYAEIYPFFGDFRDFEPYTELLLYIPYVGYIPLSTNDFMGTRDKPRNIGVKMIVDLITGSCNALIYKDDLVIQTANGTIGLQIPITGIQQADFANAVHNAEYQTKLSLATTVGSLASSTIGGITSGITGNGMGTASSIVNIANTITTGALTADNLQYNLQHTKVPFKVSGSASPACDFDNEQICRIIIKRPLLDNGYNNKIYAKTVGFACCINSTLSNFKGMTVCSNIIINSDATAAEKNMIHSQLTKGVIL